MGEKRWADVNDLEAICDDVGIVYREETIQYAKTDLLDDPGAQLPYGELMGILTAYDDALIHARK